MKSIYVCEKCGKQFTESEDAYQCENKHMEVDCWSEYKRIMDEMAVYKEGEAIPNLITIELKTPWRENATFATFKLVSELTEKEKQAIKDKREAQK